MILHRFMSLQEYELLISGHELHNFKIHSMDGCRTSSVGFCFFEEDPDVAVRWLGGIVCLDMCVTMEVPDKMCVKSWGLYLNAKDMDMSKPMNYDDLMRTAKFSRRTEFCCCRYSKRQVQIISATNKYSLMYPSRAEYQGMIDAMLRGEKI